MIKLSNLLNESLDDPYRYSNSFKTETVNVDADSSETVDVDDDSSGETYAKEVLSPVQIIKFKTTNGISYIWYAKQSRYDDTVWEIAFGVEKGIDYRGAIQLDIGVTGTGNASRIFATVLAITNSFIEMDENYEIRRILFTSKGDNRTRLYVKYLVPRIENFKIENVRDNLGETEVMLIRTH